MRASRQQVETIVGYLAANGGPDNPIPTRHIFNALSEDGSTPLLPTRVMSCWAG